MKRLCAVHANKPRMCQIDVGKLHPRMKTKACKMCGSCCNLSPAFTRNSPSKAKVIIEVKRQAALLREVGVDADKVVAHIKRTNRVPMRGELKLRKTRKGPLTMDHCALLVPAETVNKHRGGAGAVRIKYNIGKNNG